MKNSPRIRLNVCKSFGCPNLGIPDAPDYVFPVWRLGYPALMCRQCGSLPPLFNEPECEAWFSRFFAGVPDPVGVTCPHGCTGRLIRYGYTRRGRERFQCCDCRKVFSPDIPSLRHEENMRQFLLRLERGGAQNATPDYRLLRLTAAWCEQRVVDDAGKITRIATDVLILPFQGKEGGQQLYVILSADAQTGHIVQITSNYCRWRAGTSLQYAGSIMKETLPADLPAPERVMVREAQFMKRSQFDEIRYGNAVLKQNDPGSIVRPVMALHAHFQRLKRRFPRVQEHYLSHEIVLRGAAMTAWAQEVTAGQVRLWFVVEDEKKGSLSGSVYHYRGSQYIGWWGNVWQHWQLHGQNKMVGLLTGQTEVERPEDVTLSGCHAFSAWLKNHPWSGHAEKKSAGVLSLQLICLAGIYNQSHCRGQGRA